MILPSSNHHLGQIPQFGARITTQALVLVAIALSFTPAVFANEAPILDSFTASPPVVRPGETTTLTFTAHDPDCPGVCDSSAACGQYIRSDLIIWTAPEGVILSEDDGVSGSPLTASMVWQAPNTEGTYTISVYIADNGGFACGGRQSISPSIDIQVSQVINDPPVVESVTVSRPRVFPDETAVLIASAADPEGQPLTFNWSTDFGSVVPTGFGTAKFTAPLTPGVATVTCEATDPDGGVGTNTATLVVTSAEAEKAVVDGLATPQRVAAASTGELYVADKSAGGLLKLNLFSGQVVDRYPVGGIVSVDVDWNDRPVIASRGGVAVLDSAGSQWLTLPIGPGRAAVTDVAADSLHRRYVVLFGASGIVEVFDESGQAVVQFGGTGTEVDRFQSPTAVAVGPGGEIVVADSDNGQIKVFDLNGNPIRQFGELGGQAGEFIQLDDVEVGLDGTIYATDSYQSWIQVFSWTGALYEILGTFGESVGEFQTPAGVAVDPVSQRLVATSVNTSSLQFFVLNRSAPTGPEVDVSPTSLTFSGQAVGSMSSERTVSVRNTGTVALSIYGVEVEGDYDLSSNCETSLGPAEACEISVVFAPQGSGERPGRLTINDGTAEGPHRVELSGLGFVAASADLTLTPQVVEFEDVVVGAIGVIHEVVLGNPGTARVFLQSLQVDGDFVMTSGCGSYLDPGQTCVAGVRFNPGSAGFHAGQLWVTHSGEGSVATVALSGSGIGPELTINPASVDFGEVSVGQVSTPVAVELHNTGNATLTIGSVVVSGEYSTVAGCDGVVLDPGATCVVMVVFSPQRTGTRSGTLTAIAAGVGGETGIALGGVGAGADLFLSPAQLDFGSVGVGAVGAQRTSKIISLGTSPLVIDALSITGINAADYAIVSDDCSQSTLPRDGFCRVTIEFNPEAVGRRVGLVTVVSNAVGGGAGLPLAGDATGQVDLELAMNEIGNQPGLGKVFSYEINYTNVGSIAAIDTFITEIVPEGTTFSPNQSSPGWLCSMGGGAGDECILEIGAVDTGVTGSVDFSVTLDDPPPLGVAKISNTAVITDDGSSGPDLTPENNTVTVESVIDDEPPTVVGITAISGGDLVANCTTLRGTPSGFAVSFSEAMYDSGDPADYRDVTNPKNYSLVMTGPDGDFENSGCGPVRGDDVQIPIVDVLYDSVSLTAEVLTEQVMQGQHRLLVCGSMGLADWAGNPLDGSGSGAGGDDHRVVFRVDPENLFENGDLDCNMNGWDPVSANVGEIAFSETDVLGSSVSGSIEILPSSLASTFGVQQCVQLDEVTALRLNGSLQLTLPSGSELELSADCRYFAGFGCDRRELSTALLEGTAGDTNGSWMTFQGPFDVPVGANSALCGIYLSREAGVDFNANIDALVLLPDEALFSDGFESGDTSVWSGTVGQ